MQKLIEFHRLFTALGAGLGALGLGLGASHPAHMWLVAAGGALGTIGAELARAWKKPEAQP